MRHLYVILLLLSRVCVAQTTMMIGSTPVVVDSVQTGLDVPWEIIYGPDKQLWITERKGLVSRIDPVLKTKQALLDITASVFQYSESGLLGMALHPSFSSQPEVFLVYTYGPLLNMKERLVKYTYNGSALINPQILLDSIPAAVAHDGSRLIFLPDNTLLMTTGDAQNDQLSQNLNSLNGKVLRIKTDGSIPPDNPIPGSYIYSYGHRNTQGLHRSSFGKLYISEHGTNADDEFGLLEPNRNYGWPDVQGFCDTPAENSYCSTHNIKEPLLHWTPSHAPSDMIYYLNNSFPEFDGKFLMTVLKNKRIIAIGLNSSGTQSVSQQHYLVNQFGRLRDICEGDSGEIFLATNGANAANIDPNTHSIIRLRPPVPVVGLAELPGKGFNIYPNPAAGQLHVECPAECMLVITDLLGQVKLQQRIKNKDLIDVEHLEKGVYMSRFRLPSGHSIQRKFVKL